MDVRKRFGRRIKEMRQAKGLSQKALARFVELDTSYIAGIEEGERDISIEMIQKLSIALQVNISALFEGIELFEVP
jgi:transcriptional regulator with XRE-family HTH domain